MLLFQFLCSCFRPCCSWRILYIDCVSAIAGVLFFGGVVAHSVPAIADAPVVGGRLWLIWLRLLEQSTGT